ncbi:MAG: hypothetical protein ABIT70_05725 [Sulfuriferula sp.]
MGLKICVSGDQQFVAVWHQICDKQAADERELIAGLRKAGFKAAHPNDGWVNRKDCEVYFAYPQFNDGAKGGDLVMLGWPFDKKSWRTVRLVSCRRGFVGGLEYWLFKDVPNVEGKGP